MIKDSKNFSVFGYDSFNPIGFQSGLIGDIGRQTGQPSTYNM